MVRAFSIARGETAEAVIAIEVAVRSGCARKEALQAVLVAGNRSYAPLNGIIR
jgi:hypothetical protein